MAESEKLEKEIQGKWLQSEPKYIISKLDEVLKKDGVS